MCQLRIQFGHCLEEIFASLFSYQGKMGGEVDRALHLTSKDTQVTVNLIFIEIKILFLQEILKQSVHSFEAKFTSSKHTPDSKNKHVSVSGQFYLPYSWCWPARYTTPGPGTVRHWSSYNRWFCCWPCVWTHFSALETRVL